MPADRARRDAAAKALAAFLRGESTRYTLELILEHLTDSRNAFNFWEDPYLESELPFWISVLGPSGELAERDWKRLCRHLAFLKTDGETREDAVDAPTDP